MRKFYSRILTLLLLVFSVASANAQLTGNKTIPGDYPSIADAVTDLNTQGVGAGGVTFLVAADHTETTTAEITITASGSLANPIKFQKDGTGANPKITRTDAGTLVPTTLGANGDAIVRINGGDGIQFLAIDLEATNQGIEYGYFTNKTSATNGVQDLLISNSTITMNKGTSAYVIGIHIGNGTTSLTSATGVTVSSLAGRNASVTLSGNTIQNVHTGIYSRGSSASAFYDNAFTFTNNTIQNYGGGSATTTYGMYFIYVDNTNVSGNTVNNAGGGGSGHASTLYGIFLSTANNANVSITNNTIQLTSSSTTSATYAINNGAGGSGTSNTVTLSGNIVENLSWTTATSGTFYGVYQSATAFNSNVHGNFVRNNTKTGTGSMFLVYNANTGTNGFANTYNNNVYNNSTSGSGSIYGVYSNPVTTTTGKVYSNNVYSLSSGGGTVYGVYKATGATTDVYKNKVYDLTSTGTGGDVFGIYSTTGTTTNIYNNLVGDLKTPDANLTNAIAGLYINTGTTVNAWFNTIYVNASSTSVTNFGTSGIYTASNTPVVELKNNIVVNTSTALGTGKTAAFRRGTTDLSNYSSTSNNNLWYAGTPSATNVIYTDGTNTHETLAAFQAMVSPAESASKTEMPPFISTIGASAGFLHIDPAVQTRVEGNGTPITGISDDYDGDTRHASNPDIGADEFAGTPLAGCTSTPTPGTISGTAAVCSGSGSTLTLGGHTIEAAVTYQWQSSATSGGTFTNIAGATGEAYNTGGLSSTTYFRVLVTCTNTAQSATTPEFQVTVNPLPAVTAIAASPSICNGTTTTITASGADTYVWSPATGLDATSGATVTTSTTITRTYTVTGTDVNGCINTADVTVTVNPAITATATATPATVCLNGTSQLSAATANRSYSLTAIPFAPLMASGSATILADDGVAVTPLSTGTLDEGRWEAIPLPFTFNFYGTDYTSFNVTTNGYLTFGPISANGGYNNTIPNTGAPNNVVHIATADLDFRNPTAGTNTGKIEYEVQGTAPNRVLLVTFISAPTYNQTSTTPPAGTVTAQALIYEGTNIIEIHTQENSNTTRAKAQGVENSTGTAATVVPGRNNTTTWTGLPDGYRFTLNPVTYSWTPSTFLNNTNTANPIASNMTATTTYTVTITDAVTGCAGTADVTVTVGEPLVVNTSASQMSVCFGTSTTLNSVVSGGGQPYTYSWHDGTSIVSTSQSFIDTPATTTTYTLSVTDACGTTVNSQVTVTVNSPAVTSTTPATRCGIGSVTLQATSAAGTTLTWYETPTSSTPLATGGSYTTPVISSTTSYYVAASEQGPPQNGGRTAPDAGASSTTASNYGLVFDLNTNVILQTVDVYSNSVSGGNAVIELRNSGGTVLQTATVAIPGGDGSTPYAVPLNFVIPAGTGYRLVAVSSPSMIREFSVVGFPFALGSVGSITQGTTSTTYYYFYNWSIRTFCEGPRTEVIATVNTPPSISISASAAAICQGGSTTLTVSSANSGYTYSWMPGSLTGSSITVSPANSTKYFVTATDASGGASNGCATTDSFTVVVNKLPPVPTVTATPAAICPGGSSQLTAESLIVFPSIKFTEVTQFRTGDGQTPTYPSTVGSGDDLVEISNLHNQPVDVTGLMLEFWNGTALNRTWTVPAGTIIPANGVMVLHLGTGTDNAGNLFFNTGGTSNILTSSEATGLVLKASGVVVDAVATNGYSWPAASGITSAQWSGDIPSSSGDAGVIRVQADDNNLASDWIVSTVASPQSIGTYNGGYTPVAPAVVSYSWSPVAGLSDPSIANPIASPTATTTYTVTATESANGCTSSATITVTVQAPPVITTEPAANTVCEGSNATFTVAATGTALTYQWRKAGVDITGATSATLTISNVTAADAANYSVVVSGSCAPAATSADAALTVNAATVISAQPVAQTVCDGSNASFSVTATGTAVTYQWRKNGTDITGATTNTLNLTSVTSADAGNYDVVVSGTCGNVTSTAVALTVNAATAISTQPVAQAVCANAAASFSVTATGTGTLTYQWRKNGTDITGATTNTLNIANASAADAANYDVVVTGDCGTVTSTAVALTLLDATTINTQPSAQTVCEGAAASFTVVATGAGTLTYQWRKGGTDISGATSGTLNIAAATMADAGSYDVVVTGGCGSVTSSVVTLTVNAATVITTQPAAQAICAGANASFTVAATGTGTLTYQWRKGGTNISGATSNTLAITNASAADAANYDVVVTGDCGSVTSNAVALTLKAATSITTQPAAQAVCAGANATFTVVANGAGTLTYQWRKAGTNITGATAATYTITGVAAGDAANYDVVVTGDCGSVTSTAVALTLNAGTTITTQPTAQTVCSGANASFTVVAAGTGTLTYQWRKGGANISGATSATYTITGATTAAAGNYDVVVTGTCGTVTSNSVALTVNTCTSLPVIDSEITHVVLRPNVFEYSTILDVNAQRTAKINWTITDANGRVVETFSTNVSAGKNEHPLMLSHLAGGVYFISGETTKGRTTTLRFVKL